MKKIEVVKYEDKWYEQVVNLELKEFDRREVEASTTGTIKETMEDIISDCGKDIYLIIYKDTVSAIFGVAPSTVEDVGIGYLLTDERMWEYRWEMARYSKQVFKHLLEEWQVITNFVTKEHRVSISWLKRFGAIIHPEEYYFENPDRPFYRFEIRKEYIQEK
jgi:hypothetical protein